MKDDKALLSIFGIKPNGEITMMGTVCGFSLFFFFSFFFLFPFLSWWKGEGEGTCHCYVKIGYLD